MTPKKKNFLILTLISILAFLAANLDYPKYFNQAADFLNSKLSLENKSFKFPHFWNLPFKLGLDLQGGVHLIYRAELSDIPQKEKEDSLYGLKDVIERRVNLFGVQEPVIQVQGEKLIVELAGVVDPQKAIEEIGKTPFLEFREQKSEQEIKKIEEKKKEIEGKSFEDVQKIDNWQIAFESPFENTSLTGKYLKKAELAFDPNTNKPMVSLQFNDEGAKIFEELTKRNIGKPLAIYIDNQLISAPVVQEAISGGKAQITGSFTIKEARDLARNLNAGALPVPIKLISQQTIGPTLGKIALAKSLKASIFGFLAIILFMALFYRLPGLIAGLALSFYVIFLLAIFKLIPVTLTLAGIGGLILSIGMAVDANILIFSRMREELKEGKTFSLALEEGFRRAWPSIRDGNFTTLIVALILFGFGTSFIKGFAFTLIFGILMSMFSAIIVTKSLLRIFVGTRFEKIKSLWV